MKATLFRAGLVALGLLAIDLPAGGYQAPAPARYYNPRFSEDGTKVIFESTRDGAYTIYSVNTDGTGLRKLTNSRQDDAQPQWSPEGSMVVFTRKVGNVQKVFVMDATGRGARQISTGPRNDAAPSFSRDGKHVAWAATSEKPEDWREIGVAAVDGTGERLITSGPGNDQAPVWISNTRLVFVTEFPPKSDWLAMTPEDHVKRRASAEIVAVDIDGSRLTQLTRNTNQDHSPGFASAAGRVFFRSDRGGVDEIWSMNADGSDARRVDASLSGGAVSADGKMLTYSKLIGDRSGIFVRPVGGIAERELIGGDKPRDVNHWNPAWSPDGRWITFESNQDLADPGYSIYVVATDGTGLKKLSTASKEESQPAWSPDGRWIVVDQQPSVKRLRDEITPPDMQHARSGQEIIAIRSDGSETRKLTNNTDEECCARVSADGKGVTYAIGESNARRYFFTTFDGAAPRPIEPAKVDGISGERSPDETFVAVTRKANGVSGVYVVEVATGRERLIAGGK